MKRTVGFAVILGADLLAITVLVVWYLFSFQPHGGSLGEMMGQMAGYGAKGNLTLAMPGEVWLAMVGLTVLGR